jgi:holin-like protein
VPGGVLTRLARSAGPLLHLGLLFALWWVGEVLVRLAGIPLPGSIVGFGLLLALLATGWLPEARIAPGAGWLLDRMLVLFVPALLAILEYPQFLGATGLAVLLVIVAGSAVVMAVTAWTVCLAIRLRARDGR